MSHMVPMVTRGARSPRLTGTPTDRFWPKVDTSAGPGGCWPWLAGLSPDGYGMFTIDGVGRPAHRVAWELEHGLPWPDGLVADHLCHTRDRECPGSLGCAHRRCVNPAHIEPVTQLVNLHRSPHTNAGRVACPRGHPYSEANTYRSNGRRLCRTCRGAKGLVPGA